MNKLELKKIKISRLGTKQISAIIGGGTTMNGCPISKSEDTDPYCDPMLPTDTDTDDTAGGNN